MYRGPFQAENVPKPMTDLHRTGVHSHSKEHADLQHKTQENEYVLI